jgi:hypothetical protein
MNKINFWLLILPIVLLSCKKDKGTPTPVVVTPPTPITYKSDNTANLNVVYFIPTDMTAYADYEKRISEVLLDGQAFFKREMERNGFGAKTFGLLKDDNYKRVKIITLKGKLDKSNYTYADATKALAEIKDYFTANPAEKTSEHTLIILPSPLNADGTPVGSGTNPNLAVPFYGYGKWCFIKDFPTFSMANIANSQSFVGGTHHELGHALGLPHNLEKASEKATLGTSLMGSGNQTYGKSPTFLAKADCAILNNNQIFNGTSITYYGTASATVNRIYASFANQKIVVSGKMTATGSPVTDVLFYHDGSSNGFGTNKDYDAVAWAVKTIGTDSFYVEMPTSELREKDTTKYLLNVRMVHQNGVVSDTDYPYAFENGVPAIEFGYKQPILRTNWSVTASSEDPLNSFGVTGFAKNMLDGDLNTSWQPLRPSNGGASGGVYNFTVNMTASTTLKGLIMTNRQNNNAQHPKTVDIEVSNDGTTWQRILTDYETPQTVSPINILFKNTVTCKYFRVTSKAVWGGAAQNPAVAEINAFSN